MHFLMTDEYVRAREVELFLAAQRKRTERRPGALRRHVGWLLVEAGLRLAVPKPAALRRIA